MSRGSPGRASLRAGSFRSSSRQLIAQVLHEDPHGRRPAQGREQEVGRRVVAQGHHRLAQCRERHAGGASMMLRDRRVGLEIPFRVDDPAIEAFLATIDARQHQGCQQELERAAHRKALVCAMTDKTTTRGVERGDPEATAVACLQFDEACGPIFGKGRQSEQRTGNHHSARHRSSHCRSAFFRGCASVVGQPGAPQWQAWNFIRCVVCRVVANSCLAMPRPQAHDADGIHALRLRRHDRSAQPRQPDHGDLRGALPVDHRQPGRAARW